MAHSFKTSMGGKTFKVFAESSTSGVYTYNKKARASYCNRNKCPINVKVGSQSNLILYNNAFLLNSSKSRCIRTLGYDNTELYINLISKLDLSGNLPIITDLSGQAHPVKIDASNNPLPPYLTYDVDPSGVLFGDTICGINNYVRFMVYDISANVHHHVARERSEIPFEPEPVTPPPVTPTPVTPTDTTFTLTDGTRQTIALSSGQLYQSSYSSISPSAIKSVFIGTNVNNIAKNTFMFTPNLQSIKVDSNNINYSSDNLDVLFDKKITVLIRYPIGNNQTSYTIPNTVTSIEANALIYAASLTSITIPSSVTSIGEGAFSSTSNLQSIEVPSSVTSIGKDAFYSMGSLQSLIVNSNNSNYSSDNYGVLFDKKITLLIQYPIGNNQISYTIPNTVTSIEANAFTMAIHLQSITIPSSVTSIGVNAFQVARGLQSITIPSSVTNIGASAFIGGTSLTSITVDTNNPNYSSDNYGVLFDKKITLLIQYPIGNNQTSYTIPNTVTSIEANAFLQASNLQSITIPSSVTSIGENAFAASGLTSVIFESPTNRQTLKVSIGGNATFFGSGPVTISIAPEPEPEFSLYFLNNGTGIYNFAQQFTTTIKPNTKATFEIILTGSDEILNNNKFFSAPPDDSSTNSEKWYKIAELQDINDNYSIVNVITSTSDANGLVTFLFTGQQREIDNWTTSWDQIGYIFMNLALFASVNPAMQIDGITLTFKVTESTSGITKITTINGSDFQNLIKASPVIDNISSNYISFDVGVSKYVKIKL